MDNILGIDQEKIDWIFIRQALSISLLKKRPVRIYRGYGYIEENQQYKPLFHDISETVKNLNFGELYIENENIIFFPGSLKFGLYCIVSGDYSSAVEIILFLLPTFFFKEFRSVLKISGVTHTGLSYPPVFIRETLFSILEQAGLYGSISLKRFGFYGSGGGEIEARIYPAEVKKIDNRLNYCNTYISGARIYISHLGPENAKKEKDMICSGLALNERDVSIIDVRDSNGYGNFILINLSADDIPVVLFRSLPVYNEKGEYIFNPDNNIVVINELIDEAKRFVNDKDIPDFISREVMLFRSLSGSVNDYFLENNSEPVKILDLF